jgi:hypothetical protein
MALNDIEGICAVESQSTHLGEVRCLAGLVLCDLVHCVLCALLRLAESLPLLWYVHHLQQ